MLNRMSAALLLTLLSTPAVASTPTEASALSGRSGLALDPAKAQNIKASWVQLCMQPNLEEAMLLSVEAILHETGFRGHRTMQKCQGAADVVLGKNDFKFGQYEVFTLEPMKYLSNVISLTVANSADLDLATFSHMPQLKAVELIANGWTDFSFLSDLPLLENFTANESALITASFPAAPWAHLSSLALTGIQLQNWNVLKNATELEVFQFVLADGDNAMNGGKMGEKAHIRVNWLTGATKLTKFIVSGAEIPEEDFMALDGKPLLIAISIQGTPVTKLAFLDHLPSLVSLGLSGTGLSYFPDLKTYKKLLNFVAPNNSLSNIDFVREATLLQALVLSNNGISDISALSTLPKLRILLIGSNSIRSVAPLAGDLDLNFMDFGLNCVDDMAVLTRLTKPHKNSNKDTIQLFTQGDDTQRSACD